jgi:D-beta-D-heptose 7-phosphate kinase/D-beta-D-heptose 1-phosphate adenosyltransferase
VKGGDYSEDTIVGAAEVKGWGGKVVVVPITPGHSTTNIIKRLSESR